MANRAFRGVLFAGLALLLAHCADDTKKARRRAAAVAAAAPTAARSRQPADCCTSDQQARDPGPDTDCGANMNDTWTCCDVSTGISRSGNDRTIDVECLCDPDAIISGRRRCTGLQLALEATQARPLTTKKWLRP